jgi:hypothetical protein
MTRLEAAVRSPIAFRRKFSDRPERFLEKPETVGIKFDGRLFVWHAFPDLQPDPFFGDRELGPSVTTLLTDDDDYADVATELERFLSALAYHYDQPAEVTAYGSSGERDPFHPSITRAPRTHAGWMMAESYEVIRLQRNPPAVLQAIAYFREGLNAGSPFYRFMAYWNCIDATFDGDIERRSEFLRRTVPLFRGRWDDRFDFPKDPVKYFWEESRNAVAHAVRHSRRSIDPDADHDRRRLDDESRFLNLIARRAIEREFDRPVMTGDTFHP